MLRDSEWERRQGTGRPASGDSSSRRERRENRETDGDREKEGEMEVGRALFKGNAVNVHKRCL